MSAVLICALVVLSDRFRFIAGFFDGIALEVLALQTIKHLRVSLAVIKIMPHLLFLFGLLFVSLSRFQPAHRLS